MVTALVLAGLFVWGVLAARSLRKQKKCGGGCEGCAGCGLCRREKPSE